MLALPLKPNSHVSVINCESLDVFLSLRTGSGETA